MNKTNLLAAVIGLSLFGGMSVAKTYSCTIKDARNSGWLPEKIAFDVNATTQAVQVYDPITFSTLGRIETAHVNSLNSVRVSFGWSTGVYLNKIAKPTRDNPSPAAQKIQYRATLLKGSDKVLVKAYVGGANAPSSARGDCQQTDTPLSAISR